MGRCRVVCRGAKCWAQPAACMERTAAVQTAGDASWAATASACTSKLPGWAPPRLSACRRHAPPCCMHAPAVDDVPRSAHDATCHMCRAAPGWGVQVSQQAALSQVGGLEAQIASLEEALTAQAQQAGALQRQLDAQVAINRQLMARKEEVEWQLMAARANVGAG